MLKRKVSGRHRGSMGNSLHAEAERRVARMAWKIAPETEEKILGEGPTVSACESVHQEHEKITRKGRGNGVPGGRGGSK